MNRMNEIFAAIEEELQVIISWASIQSNELSYPEKIYRKGENIELFYCQIHIIYIMVLHRMEKIRLLQGTKP